MIRVVLVDDQTLVRRGIRSLLEFAGDIAIVAEAADGDEGIDAIRRERPAVVRLDVRMPKKEGGWGNALDPATQLPSSAATQRCRIAP